MRRARKRMRWADPGLSDMSIAELCELELSFREQLARSKELSPEAIVRQLRLEATDELRLIGFWAEKMSPQELRKEVRFLEKHRVELRNRLRTRLREFGGMR